VFHYDLAGRLSDVISRAGEFDYQYLDSLPSTLVQQLLLPNGGYITNTYDGSARMLSTALINNTNGVLNLHEYAYNVGNQRTNQMFIDSSSVAYKYDNIGQLKVADSSINSEDRGYLYDAAWNVNDRTNGGVVSELTADEKNELTSIQTGGETSYDDNGNLTFYEIDDGEEDFQYDDENRMIDFFGQEGDYTTETQYIYDGFGRLRRCIVDGDETRYIYDGMRVIQERDGGNGPTLGYTRGSDLSGSMEGAGGIGGLLALSSRYSSGNWIEHYFYHADGNGNITCLVSNSQAMAAQYKYDPFGNIISKNGPAANLNTYRFSSKQVFPDGAFVRAERYYYGYRWYEPFLQRWLNQDPIGERGGVNLYDYVVNNPIRYVDPLGTPRITPF
jgi:RHS repeat-associated protein